MPAVVELTHRDDVSKARFSDKRNINPMRLGRQTIKSYVS